MSDAPGMTDVPAALVALMRNAVGDVAPTTSRTSGDLAAADPAQLARAAQACLRGALTTCDDRAAALPLLAADALITMACERADEDGLRRLATEWSPERLAAMMPA